MRGSRSPGGGYSFLSSWGRKDLLTLMTEIQYQYFMCLTRVKEIQNLNNIKWLLGHLFTFPWHKIITILYVSQGLTEAKGSAITSLEEIDSFPALFEIKNPRGTLTHTDRIHLSWERWLLCVSCICSFSPTPIFTHGYTHLHLHQQPSTAYCWARPIKVKASSVRAYSCCCCCCVYTVSVWKMMCNSYVKCEVYKLS